jgi:hypothetical protein
VAGAADRGDFDATSTTMALNPAQAALPPGLLQATFDRYWQESEARSRGQRRWRDYTPYELRTVGAFTRLGQPERAHAMLDFFFKDQRPRGWNQWAEVVLPDAREPRFLGDMPHAWVSSDYIRSALDLFAFDREAQGALVIGAGLKAPGCVTPVACRCRACPRPTARCTTAAPAGPGLAAGPAACVAGPARRSGAALARRAGPAAGHAPGPRLPWVGRELALPAPPAVVDLATE